MLREGTVTTLRILSVLCLFLTSTAQNQSVTVYENDAILLACNHGPHVSQFVQVWWFRGLKELASYTHFGHMIATKEDWHGRANFTTPFTDGNVKISRILLKDDAFHRCQYTDPPKTHNWIINLTVLVKPNQPTISGLDAALKEGDNVPVTCTVTRVKPANFVSISWTVQANAQIKGDISSTKNTDGKTFSVRNVATLRADRQKDGKTLTCHVMWNNMDNTTNVKILNVNYPPRSVSLTPGGATRVKQGTSVTMTCRIGEEGAKPLPTLSIFKEGITEPVKSQHNTAQMTHTMSIQREDNGKVFKCKATGGLISGSVDSQGISYDVLYPASSVTVTGVSGPVLEGLTTRLHCQAVDGNPNTYTYKWAQERNGQRSDLTESSSNLTLSEIQYTAAGQYKCQAINEYGPAEGFMDIVVHYSPVEDPNKIHNLEVWVKTGDTKNLTINVVALPANVAFSWVHTQKKVKPKNVINNGLSSTLTLMNIREANFGYYICIASNAINQPAAFLFYVWPQQAPFTPEKINIVRRTAVSLTVKWKRSFDGGFKQYFKISYQKIGTSEVKETGKIKDPFPESKYAERKVSPLDPSSEYVLYVVAFSDFKGGSKTLSSHLRAQTPARPQFHLDQLIVENKQREARLRWVRPTGQYTHYVIEWCEKPGKTNCKTENQGNETTSTTVSGLSDGQEYSFVLKVYDGDDLVGELNESSPADATMDPLPIAIAVPLILIIVTGAVVLTVILRRRICEGTTGKRANAETTGRSLGEQTLSPIIAETSKYENPLGKTSTVGTPGTTEYANVSFHTGEEVAEVNSPMSDKNQQYSAYQNIKPEVHVYEDVPSLPREPTLINTEDGAPSKHTGEYEQLSADARTPHSNNEPNVYKQLERR